MLYYGTRFLSAIEKQGFVRVSNGSVDLTPIKRVANYWANVPRKGDEGTGYILCFRMEELMAAGYDLKIISGSRRNPQLKVRCLQDIDFRLWAEIHKARMLSKEQFCRDWHKQYLARIIEVISIILRRV